MSFHSFGRTRIPASWCFRTVADTENVARRFFASKLALPIIEPIDNYNHNMDGVDRAD